MDFDERIEWLRGLGYNWNGHGGVPPSERLIDNAERLHGLVAGAGFGSLSGTARLFPSQGSVTIRYGLRDRFVWVHIGWDSVSWQLGGLGWKDCGDVAVVHRVGCDFTPLPEGLAGVLEGLN